MKKIILDKIFKIINKDSIISIIYYGNRKGYDIDLCLIINTSINYQKLRIAELDLTIFNKEYFLYLTKLLSPLVSEPILTGNIIYGKNIKSYKMIILNSVPNKNTINHLYNYANQIFKASKKLYLEKKYIDSLTNIFFSLSYIAYADYYKQASKVILFKDLISIKSCPILNQALIFNKKRKIKIKELNWFMYKTELMLNARQI